jgi:xanthine dehydrogenase YagS FAD-binding subunit
MKPFQFLNPGSLDKALETSDDQDSMWLSGGTTLVDLMKLNILTPTQLVFVKPLLSTTIQEQDGELFIGAGCTMAEVASHQVVAEKAPVIKQSLLLAASPQIRNMATIGGNLLQRTRSPYFRHIEFEDRPRQVNDRGSQEAEDSSMAILGHNGSLVGTYPGDFGVALTALGGKLHLKSRDAERVVEARQFYLPPAKSHNYRTILRSGEIIAGLSIPVSAASMRSMYLKVRERSSYAFALASAAIGLALEGTGTSAKIIDARVGLGGIATIPWASPEAEAALRGQSASDAVFETAATAALAAAQPPTGVEFKVTLAKRVLVRALQTLRDHGVPDDRAMWAFQHGRNA